MKFYNYLFKLNYKLIISIKLKLYLDENQLCNAIINGHVEIVKFILQSKEIDINYKLKKKILKKNYFMIIMTNSFFNNKIIK